MGQRRCNRRRQFVSLHRRIMATELQTVRTTEREFFDAFEFVAPSVQIDRLMQWLAEQGDDVEDVTRFSGGRVVWTMSPVRFPLEVRVLYDPTKVSEGKYKVEANDPIWYSDSGDKMAQVRDLMMVEGGMGVPSNRMDEWLEVGFGDLVSHVPTARERTFTPSVEEIAGVFLARGVVPCDGETRDEVIVTRRRGQGVRAGE